MCCKERCGITDNWGSTSVHLRRADTREKNRMKEPIRLKRACGHGCDKKRKNSLRGHWKRSRDTSAIWKIVFGRQKTILRQCRRKMTPTTRMMMTERQKTAGTSRQNTAGETQDKHFFQRPAACREAESGCRISHNAAEIRQREISGHEIPDLLRYLALYRWGLLCEGNTDESCLLMR